MEAAEKECGALGGLFQAIVNDMKSSYPVWEDFNSKATKLHSQLRNPQQASFIQMKKHKAHSENVQMVGVTGRQKLLIHQETARDSQGS